MWGCRALGFRHLPVGFGCFRVISFRVSELRRVVKGYTKFKTRLRVPFRDFLKGSRKV